MVHLVHRKPANVCAPQVGWANIVIVHAVIILTVYSVERCVLVKMEHPVTLKTVRFYFINKACSLLFNFTHFFNFMCAILILHVLVLLPGFCTCAAGFSGPHCEYKCVIGTFGQNCSQTCDCEDGHHNYCDPVTGKCICKPEWKGVYLFFSSVPAYFDLLSLTLNCCLMYCSGQSSIILI